MSTTGYSIDSAGEQGFTPGVIAALGISALPGVGPMTLRQLGDPNKLMSLFEPEDLEAFAAALNACGAKFAPWSAGINNWQELRKSVWNAGSTSATDLLACGVQCITPSSAHYPKRLNDLGTRRPNWLFLRGDASLLQARSVAVVGTRDPSDVGDFLTRTAVSTCRSLNLPVVSGLAKGIDSIAHHWSLRLRLPTISVLGSGMLLPYPMRNAEMADEIVREGGLLISEYLPRQQPTAEMFVWRNRLQACIAQVVVATEWKRSSGTAHTVRFANELNRPTVSTALDGAMLADDAGRGKHHFLLPAQHTEFAGLLQGAADDSVGDGTAPEALEGIGAGSGLAFGSDPQPQLF